MDSLEWIDRESIPNVTPFHSTEAASRLERKLNKNLDLDFDFDLDARL